MTVSDFAWPLVLAIVLYFVTAIPYSEAARHAASDSRFVGQAALGDAISALLAATGWRVTREFYYNDGGGQITNLAISVQARVRWMDETIDATIALRRAGLPVLGYTWFPLITMIDWDYRTGTKPLNDYLLHLGLYDSDFNAEGSLIRKATLLVKRYCRHIMENRQVG